MSADQRTIAERLFDGHYAESDLEDKLEQAGFPETMTLGWDWYDCSLEIHGVAPDFRLSKEALQIVRDAGFARLYVNHADKWETHYTFKAGEDAKPWRVSYPHKRGEGEKGIWVEEVVPTWPPAWFESGYCIVKSNENAKENKL